MDRLEIKRVNRLQTMLINEWKDLDFNDRPIRLEWNIMHMYSCTQIAKMVAMKRGLDVELAAIIATLHDLAVVEGRFREDHDRLAGSYVVGAIERYNEQHRGDLAPITEEETEIILNAIITHSAKETMTELPYVELIKDVDSLDRYLYGLETEGAYATRTHRLLDEMKIH